VSPHALPFVQTLQHFAAVIAAAEGFSPNGSARSADVTTSFRYVVEDDGSRSPASAVAAQKRTAYIDVRMIFSLYFLSENALRANTLHHPDPAGKPAQPTGALSR
jgi:hypothetical protein